MPILKPKSWPLAMKLSLVITVVVTAVGFMIGAVTIAQDWKRFQDVLGEKALLLSASIAITAPKAMLRKDSWSLYISLKNMASQVPGVSVHDEILSAMILDPEGTIQAHLRPADNPMGLPFFAENEIEKRLYEQAMNAKSPMVLGSGGFSKKGFREGIVPLFADQKYLGVVRVRLSVEQMYKRAVDIALIVLALILLFVAMGSALGIFVARRMVGPLTAVTQGLEAVGQGEMIDLTPIPVRNLDEIGRLSATFNEIMSQLAEKKMLEEEIAMSEKLVALGRITAGVAHEVNNPLAGLLNCIDTLQKHPDDKELIDRYLPVIDQGLHRIKEIVHNLLAGLKFEDSDKSISIHEIDKLYDLITAEIGDRDIKIVWESDADDNLQVPSILEQVACNLLKNALEVLSDRGTIHFSMVHDDTHLTLKINDDGPGIPAEIRNQLFDPFFTTKPNGTGLGLWVVYRLIQSMHGVIEVESNESQGTTFHVTVPISDFQY